MTLAAGKSGPNREGAMSTLHTPGSARTALVDVDLSEATFVRTNLSGTVMRGVDLSDADIDAPWLFDGSFLVNGVDVVPLVDEELNRRFPGRSERRASTPEGLRSCWAKLERTWTATTERVASMPDGTADISVRSEWSFAETLRHLVLATDLWLNRAILGSDGPTHPIGLRRMRDDEELPPTAQAFPTYDEVSDVRAERVGMVRQFLAAVTPDELSTPRRNPHDPDVEETTLSCLHTILEEEWEHHRYAVRDLDAITRAGTTD